MTETRAADISRNTWAMMAAGMAGSANIRAFDSALPQMAEQFGVSLGQTGHFAAAYAVAYGLCQLPFGILGDRMDKIRLVRLLGIGSALVLLLTVFAQSYGAMLALRLLAGAVASAVIPLTIAYIGDTVPFERRQMVLAWNMTLLTSGFVLGQIVGGLIADLAGWHGIPLFIAALYLPAIIGLRGGAGGARQPSGSALAPLEALRRIAGTAKSRAVLASAFLEGVAIYAAAAYFGLALAVRFDLPPSMVGLALAVNALGSVSNLLVLRNLPTGWGMRGHFSLGCGASMLGIALVGLAPWLALAVLGLFLAGLGAAAVHNNLQTFGSQMLPQSRATGFACFATTFFLSQALGGAVLAAVLDAYGMATVFLLPLPVIALLLWWFRRRVVGTPG